MLLGGLAACYVLYEAHSDGAALGANGFGSDFRGTIWAPDRALLHGHSPYASDPHHFGSRPAVYLPPIYLVTLPLGWLSFHVASWAWFGLLLVAALGTLVVLQVRDPRWYLFFLASMPVEQALVLGNASILVALGVALGWRLRHRPLLGPLAVAGAVAIKFWVWPLVAWLLIVRVRSGLRAACALVAVTLGAWAAIGFQGLAGYPALMRTEARVFAHSGALFVALLTERANVSLAAAIGLIGGLALLVLAWHRRADELEAFSLVLLAALVATPVAWPHYLILMALPLVLLGRAAPLAWAWVPALWLAFHASAEATGATAERLSLCIFAALPVILVALTRSSRLAQPPGLELSGDH